MRKPTDKQMSLIRQMEQLLDNVVFKGNTIAEASQFISKHMNAYKEQQAFVFDMVYNEYNY